MGSNIKFKAACAKGVGRSHLSTNTPCQDYICTYRNASEGLISISLSDGAGSCSLSHIGSRIIVKTVNTYLVKNFADLINSNDIENKKQNIITEIVKNLQSRVIKDNESSIKPYSGTLLAIVTDGEKYIAIHLGDGVIGCIDNNESKIISAPSNGEFSNTTYFVTDKDAVANLKVFTGDINTINSFILMSDGTQDSLYNKKENTLASAYIKLSEWLNNKTEKKVSKILDENVKKVFTQKSTDDCSIGLLNIVKKDKC